MMTLLTATRSMSSFEVGVKLFSHIKHCKKKVYWLVILVAWHNFLCYFYTFDDLFLFDFWLEQNCKKKK
jgi:hypothetical protein